MLSNLAFIDSLLSPNANDYPDLHSRQEEIIINCQKNAHHRIGYLLGREFISLSPAPNTKGIQVKWHARSFEFLDHFSICCFYWGDYSLAYEITSYMLKKSNLSSQVRHRISNNRAFSSPHLSPEIRSEIDSRISSLVKYPLLDYLSPNVRKVALIGDLRRSNISDYPGLPNLPNSNATVCNIEFVSGDDKSADYYLIMQSANSEDPQLTSEQKAKSILIQTEQSHSPEFDKFDEYLHISTFAPSAITCGQRISFNSPQARPQSLVWTTNKLSGELNKLCPNGIEKDLILSAGILPKGIFKKTEGDYKDQSRDHYYNCQNLETWTSFLNYYQTKTTSTIDIGPGLDSGAEPGVGKGLARMDIYCNTLCSSLNVGEIREANTELSGSDLSPLLARYKYTCQAEDSSVPNYFTEKIIGAIFAETLCFYWGCPNLESFIDERCFIRLTLNNFDQDIDLITNSISNDEWTKRIDVIRSEKRKILNNYQFRPYVAKLISELESRCLPYVINLDRRQDRYRKFTRTLGPEWAFVERYPAIDGIIHRFTDLEKEMFLNNDFGNTAGTLGAALSHLNLWKQLVNDPRCDYYLIFEDDIEFCSKLRDKFFSIYKSLIGKKLDLLYIGYSVWRDKRTTGMMDRNAAKIRVELLNDSKKEINTLRQTMVGGIYGYMISKECAKFYCDKAKHEGIKHGIDFWMMKFFPNLSVYITEPHLVFTEYADADTVIDSDIQYSGARIL